jgi:predicted DNA-binding protein (MmcQ/YjbR family)
MTFDEFDAYCRALPGTTCVVLRGGLHVWTVGGKAFAIGPAEKDGPGYAFKVTRVAFDILKDQPGLRPAPYLAARGLKWIQHFEGPGLQDDKLRDYLRQAYVIVALALPKEKRAELGLGLPEG